MSASHASPPQLRVVDLAIKRGERELFRSLQIALDPGEILLLRGKNGVGKSTLLLALAGIVRPDFGTIRWYPDDDEPPPGGLLHFLSYLDGLKSRLTVRENLVFWQQMNGATGVSPAEALEITGIAPLAPLEAGYLSAGQTRRLALARLLVSKRPVWLLDEPTAALDSEGDALVGKLVGDYAATGGMAIIATHHDIALPPLTSVKTMTLRAEA
jgi:heme exporter protein A